MLSKRMRAVLRTDVTAAGMRYGVPVLPDSSRSLETLAVGIRLTTVLAAVMSVLPP
eukprot:COSAG03_NODE_6286_length_1074_cov_0.817259_2_plen_55_part_01